MSATTPTATRTPSASNAGAGVGTRELPPVTPRSSSIPDYKPPVQNTSNRRLNLADRWAGQLCSTEAPLVLRTTSVADCVQRMRESGADCVLVEEANGALCGIFTDNDMVRKVVSAKADPVATRVDEVMSSRVFTVPSGCGILQAVLTMMDNKFRHMPVVKDGATFGLLYMHHCIAAVLNQLRTTAQYESDDDSCSFGGGGPGSLGTGMPGGMLGTFGDSDSESSSDYDYGAGDADDNDDAVAVALEASAGGGAGTVLEASCEAEAEDGDADGDSYGDAHGKWRANCPARSSSSSSSSSRSRTVSFRQPVTRRRVAHAARVRAHRAVAAPAPTGPASFLSFVAAAGARGSSGSGGGAVNASSTPCSSSSSSSASASATVTPHLATPQRFVRRRTTTSQCTTPETHSSGGRGGGGGNAGTPAQPAAAAASGTAAAASVESKGSQSQSEGGRSQSPPPSSFELLKILCKMTLRDIVRGDGGRDATPFVAEGARVVDVVRAMARHSKTGAAIVHPRTGRLRGILTSKDVLKWFTNSVDGGGGGTCGDGGAGAVYDYEQAATSKIYTPHPDTVPETMTVVEALEQMKHQGYTHLPVLSVGQSPADDGDSDGGGGDDDDNGNGGGSGGTTGRASGACGVGESGARIKKDGEGAEVGGERVGECLGIVDAMQLVTAILSTKDERLSDNPKLLVQQIWELSTPPLRPRSSGGGGAGGGSCHHGGGADAGRMMPMVLDDDGDSLDDFDLSASVPEDADRAGDAKVGCGGTAPAPQLSAEEQADAVPSEAPVADRGSGGGSSGSGRGGGGGGGGEAASTGAVATAAVATAVSMTPAAATMTTPAAGTSPLLQAAMPRSFRELRKLRMKHHRHKVAMAMAPPATATTTTAPAAKPPTADRHPQQQLVAQRRRQQQELQPREPAQAAASAGVGAHAQLAVPQPQRAPPVAPEQQQQQQPVHHQQFEDLLDYSLALNEHINRLQREHDQQRSRVFRAASVGLVVGSIVSLAGGLFLGTRAGRS